MLAAVALRPEFTPDAIDAAARAVAEDAALPTSSWRQAAERRLRETLLGVGRATRAFHIDEIRSAHRELTAAGNTLVVIAGGSLDDGDLPLSCGAMDACSTTSPASC